MKAEIRLLNGGEPAVQLTCESALERDCMRQMLGKLFLPLRVHNVEVGSNPPVYSVLIGKAK